jgi:hypothetical protein
MTLIYIVPGAPEMEEKAKKLQESLLPLNAELEKCDAIHGDGSKESKEVLKKMEPILNKYCTIARFT